MKIRTLFISDIHLLTQRSQADKALAILRLFEFDKLVIVGDLFDVWALKRKFYFDATQLDLIRKILKLIVKGKTVVYIRGNHDDEVSNPLGELVEIPNFSIVEEHLHTTVDGRKIICIHGHQWDMMVTKRKWLALLGDRAYSFSFYLTNLLRKLGFKFSLSNKLKGMAKKIFLGYFIECAEHYRYTHGADIVMCGHTHQPCMTDVYINTGDFVDNNSFVIECLDGRLELHKFDKEINGY